MDTGLLPPQDRVEAELGQGLTCPTPGCGAPLPVPPGEGVRILAAPFPDEPERVGALLAGAAREVTCAQCGATSTYESVAICSMLESGKGMLFAPERVARALPRLREQILASLQPALEKAGISIDLLVFSDVEEFRAAVAREIRSIAATPLSEFSRAHFTGGAALGAWVDSSADGLGRSFFAAAWLLASGVVPAEVHVGVQKGDANQLSKLTQRDILDGLRQQLRELLAYRLLRLSRSLVEQRQLRQIEKAVGRTVHPVVLDEEAVRTFANVVDVCERLPGAPSLRKYANDAVLAAASLLGGRKNPRQGDWAGWYVAAELAARDPNSGVKVGPGQRVPLAFARRTIDREGLWRQAVPRLQSLVMPKEDKPPPIMAIEALTDLLDDFDVPATWMSEALELDLEQFPPGLLDHLERQLLAAMDEHRDEARGFARVLLGTLAEGDLQRFLDLADRVVARYCDLGELASAASIACYVSSELNARSLCRAASSFLRGSRAKIEARGEWSDLGAETRAGFLTEEGNCLRYLGRTHEALRKYEECRLLVGVDLGQLDVRVNEQNRAIVLRELGRIEQSQSILKSLVPHTSGAEQGGVLLSLAQAYLAVNQVDIADGLIGQALAAVPTVTMNAALRRHLLLASAAVAQRRRRPDDTLRLAFEALELRDTSGLFEQAIVVAVGANAADDLELEPAQHETVNSLAIRILEGAVAASGGLGPSMQHALLLRAALADRYDAVGRLADGERLLAEVASQAEASDLEQGWKVWAQLARYAALRKDGAAARERLERAYALVLKAISALDLQSDPYSVMLDKDPLHRNTAQVFLDGHAAGEVDGAALRVAADLQNSLVLQHRLNRSLRVASTTSPLDVARIDADAVRGLLGHPRGVDGVGVLQFLETTRELRALLTVVTASGADTAVLPPSYSVASLTRLRQRLLFTIENWSPAREGDPLAASAEWQEFSASLHAAVGAGLAAGAPLWIVPGGTLSGLPLHAALAGYPCSHVPSLAIAHTLRKRRRRLPGGAEWRPSSVFDFVVWQHQERDNVIAAFRTASEQLRSVVEPHGVAFEGATGTAATRARLLEGLSRAACARLSCHGFAAPDARRFQLLVSDGRQLPPSSPRALQAEAGRRFLLDWEDLSEVAVCPPLIFSTACASGAAAGVPGGERVGLERPLLAAGAVAYVAPQWSVPVSGIQPLVNQVIATYVADRQRTLAEVLADEVNNAVAAGLPSWIAHSLAIHGDWL